MVKWIKIFDNQYLGFWVLGLVLVVIQELPYMIMPLLKLETNPIMNMQESSVVLNVCEKILGSLCIAFMTFIVCDAKNIFSISDTKELLFFCISMGILLLNFFGWFLYFTGHQSVFVMLFFIVVLPPLYYVFIGLWRSNIILTVTGCVFLIVHFIHVLGNLKMS
ncbi:MAG: hypothetical protein IJX86_07955 [Lachnospiraceae bacterium]|nr:hypothetical protein [Lachnospiraceae bacterium]